MLVRKIKILLMTACSPIIIIGLAAIFLPSSPYQETLAASYHIVGVLSVTVTLLILMIPSEGFSSIQSFRMSLDELIFELLGELRYVPAKSIITGCFITAAATIVSFYMFDQSIFIAACMGFWVLINCTRMYVEGRRLEYR